MNKVIIIGRLIKDPVMKTLPNGNNIGSLVIAHNKRYKDKDGNWQEIANFFEVDAFGYTAEKTSSLKKGDEIIIEGSLKQERWETNGEKRSKVKIIAEKILVVKKDEKKIVSDNEEYEMIEPPDLDNDDDVPF